MGNNKCLDMMTDLDKAAVLEEIVETICEEFCSKCRLTVCEFNDCMAYQIIEVIKNKKIKTLGGLYERIYYKK